MRKSIVFIILVLSLVLVLAGCGGKPTPAPVDTPNIDDDVVELPAEIEEDIKEEADKDIKNPFANLSNLDDYYYEMEIEVSGELIATSKIWVSGKKSRFESKSPEKQELAIMIMDGDEKVSYMYMPTQNMAMRLPFDVDEYSDDPDSDENVDFIENFKTLSDDENIKIEDGNFEGQSVQIITASSEEDITKTWVSTKTGFPLKSEYYEDGNLESVTLFKNFSSKSNDPSLFKLPDGVQVMDLTTQP